MNSTEPQPPLPSKSQGQLAVAGMIAIAILMATFAWWWNYNRGKRALDFYGPEGAILVRTAPIVEYLRPEPEGPLDISKAPGLINARASLLSDASYEWPVSGIIQESPRFSVRFRRGEEALVVTFDFENRMIYASTTQRVVKLNKKTSDGWQSYLARNSKRHESVAK